MTTANTSRVARTTERGGLLLAVAAAHVLAFIGFSQWGPAQRALFESPPLEVLVMPDAPIEFEPPPPPQPQMTSLQQPTVVLPEIQWASEPPPAPAAITLPVQETPPAVVGRADAAPRLVSDVAYVKAPEPRYPPESRRSGEEGLVVLRVVIDQLGRATHIEVEQSSGHSRLDAAAREAVQRARFRPHIENGIARAALAMIPIEFTWKSRRAQRS